MAEMEGLAATLGQLEAALGDLTAPAKLADPEIGEREHGAALGGLIGGLAGGGKGAAIGLAAGAGAGAGGSALTGNKDIVLPAESDLTVEGPAGWLEILGWLAE